MNPLQSFHGWTSGCGSSCKGDLTRIETISREITKRLQHLNLNLNILNVWIWSAGSSALPFSIFELRDALKFLWKTTQVNKSKLEIRNESRFAVGLDSPRKQTRLHCFIMVTNLLFLSLSSSFSLGFSFLKMVNDHQQTCWVSVFSCVPYSTTFFLYLCSHYFSMSFLLALSHFLSLPVFSQYLSTFPPPLFLSLCCSYSFVTSFFTSCIQWAPLTLFLSSLFALLSLSKSLKKKNLHWKCDLRKVNNKTL